MTRIPIELPLDVLRTIASLCHDYKRRAHELVRKEMPAAVLENYQRLNSAIDEALSSVCEEAICVPMREDIGLNRGHRMSPIYFLSEKAYKKRKREAKYAIAKRLYLI